MAVGGYLKFSPWAKIWVERAQRSVPDTRLINTPNGVLSGVIFKSSGPNDAPILFTEMVVLPQDVRATDIQTLLRKPFILLMYLRVTDSRKLLRW